MAEVAATHPLFTKRIRVVSGTKFAAYSLADSIALAKAIHDKGGGSATHDQLAAFLGYKSAHNGAYLDRLASAKLYGLVEGDGRQLRLTDRAQGILMPVYPELVRPVLLEAFFAVPLFKAVFDEYRGKELPPEFGLKNALRTQFGVTAGRTDVAYRSLMDSADQAGLFEIKGSRTQLIVPSAPSRRSAPAPEEERRDDLAETKLGGGNGNGGPPAVPQSNEELQREYVSTLIGMLRTKGSQGDVDADLMARIEKLLGIAQS